MQPYDHVSVQALTQKMASWLEKELANAKLVFIPSAKLMFQSRFQN